jgi:hypothetical protein
VVWLAPIFIDGLHLSPSRVLLIGLIVFVAAVLRGLTGFGFAILAVPLLGMVIDPVQAVVFAIVMQLLIGPFGVPQALKMIDRRRSDGLLDLPRFRRRSGCGFSRLFRWRPRASSLPGSGLVVFSPFSPSARRFRAGAARHLLSPALRQGFSMALRRCPGHLLFCILCGTACPRRRRADR